MTIKNALGTLLLLIAALSIRAQTSQIGFSFQGYAIDSDGKAMGSENIDVKFTLYNANTTFVETRQITTDPFGVFYAVVGNSSTAKNTEFSRINFSDENHVFSLKVEVKKTNGGIFSTINDQPMNAVPYARTAANGNPVGSVIAFAGDKNNVPYGWLVCDGRSVSKNDYPQLFAAIGNTWGTNGGSFNLPDLRGQFLRGVNDGSGNDPDAGARYALSGGGNSGDNVGTFQYDNFKTHNHGGGTHSHTTNAHSHSYKDVVWSEDGDQKAISDLASLPMFSIENYPADASGNQTANGKAYGSGDSDSDNDNLNWHRTTGSATVNVNNSSAIIQNNGGSETRPKNAAVYYIIKY